MIVLCVMSLVSTKHVKIFYSFHLKGVRATRVRMLRKEIALIRRKLNQEKRQLSESSGKQISLS